MAKRLPVVVLDGGEVTALRTLAAATWGQYEVEWPDDAVVTRKPGEGREDGYVSALPVGTGRRIGGFARRFVRADLKVSAKETTSNVEENLNLAAERTQGEVFFERDLTQAELGRLVPWQDFEIGDRLPVMVRGQIIPLVVTEIRSTVGEYGPEWTVHVGGQVVSDDDARRAANDEIERALRQERREREQLAAETRQFRTEITERVESAESSIQGGVTSAKSYSEAAREASLASSAASEAATSASQVSADMMRQAEQARNQAETYRREAETLRAQAETAREQSEQQRQQAETARQQAEKAREDSTEYLKEQIRISEVERVARDEAQMDAIQDIQDAVSRLGGTRTGWVMANNRESSGDSRCSVDLTTYQPKLYVVESFAGKVLVSAGYSRPENATEVKKWQFNFPAQRDQFKLPDQSSGLQWVQLDWSQDPAVSIILRGGWGRRELHANDRFKWIRVGVVPHDGSRLGGVKLNARVLWSAPTYHDTYGVQLRVGDRVVGEVQATKVGPIIPIPVSSATTQTLHANVGVVEAGQEMSVWAWSSGNFAAQRTFDSVTVNGAGVKYL